eukprot:scaffold447_cov307-Pinguiococcus_pyrenoidosus.AAC.33
MSYILWERSVSKIGAYFHHALIKLGVMKRSRWMTPESKAAVIRCQAQREERRLKLALFSNDAMLRRSWSTAFR